MGFEEKTNSVIVTETPQRLKEIESYIRDLDVRTPQITIKAKIVTVDRTGTEQLGLAYDLGSAGTFSNAIITRPGVTGDQRINLAGDGFAGVANSGRAYKGTSSLTVIHNMVLGGFNLTSFLDALSSVQLTDVQAEPSVTTVDNKQAELFSGINQAFLLTPPVVPGQIQAVAPQIQRQDIGIKLQVTPHVTANRQVLLDIVRRDNGWVKISGLERHAADFQAMLPLARALKAREAWAEQVLALDDRVSDVVDRLKARGLTSPYLKAFVVSRVNHLRWVKEKHPDFDDTLNTILKAARRFNPANVKADQVAKSGGAPGSDD